jgi:HEAT repeat protein
MLWDVSLYQIMIGLILFMTGVIIIGMVWVIFIRAMQKRYLNRLDTAKDRYRPMISAILEGSFERNLDPLHHHPQTVEWQAIEELLLGLMEELSGEERGKVTKVFEQLSYVDFYLQEFKVDIPWRRTVAAERLGLMRSPRAIPGLLKALEDQDRGVRQIALRVLGQIRDPQALKELVNKLERATVPDKGLSRRLVMAALVPYGEAAVTLLTHKLSDPSDAVRTLVAEILGEIASPQSLGVLIKSLEDPSPEVRSRTAYALGQIRHPLAVKPLVAALSDPFWYVRLQAARSLGRLESPQAIYELSLRLTDSHAQVRSAAAEALIKIGPLALQVLTIYVLYTRDRYAREQVSKVLQQSGLIDQWIGYLDTSDETVRKQAKDLLVAVAQAGILDVLINALQSHPNRKVRMELIDILGKSGRLVALRAIRRSALHDSEAEIRERAKAVILKTTKNAKADNGLGNLCQQPRPL